MRSPGRPKAKSGGPIACKCGRCADCFGRAADSKEKRRKRRKTAREANKAAGDRTEQEAKY